MKSKQSAKMVPVAWLVLLAMIFAPAFLSATAWADEANDAVAGCQAVAVDPAASFEYQQAVCRAAEGNASSSCAASGHGMCSSPKMNDTMVDGTNCICLADAPAETPAP